MAGLKKNVHMKNQSNPKTSASLNLQIVFAVLLIFFSSCKKNDIVPNTVTTKGTVAAQIASDPQFSILGSMIANNELSGILQSQQAFFTVFAPTDSAFALSGITSTSLSEMAPDKIDLILRYHTLTTKFLSSEVLSGPDTPMITISGDTVFVTHNANGIFINGIPVTSTELPAINGVIHPLGKALIPSFGQNLTQAASSDTSFTLFTAALARASQGSSDISGLLSNYGIYTVFLPTNNAFRAAGYPDENTINSTDPDVLGGILKYHVLFGRSFTSDLADGATPTMLNGQTVSITSSQTAVSLKGASNASASNLTATNIMATNGVIHVIDQILMPQ